MSGYIFPNVPVPKGWDNFLLATQTLCSEHLRKRCIAKSEGTEIIINQKCCFRNLLMLQKKKKGKNGLGY